MDKGKLAELCLQAGKGCRPSRRRIVYRADGQRHAHLRDGQLDKKYDGGLQRQGEGMGCCQRAYERRQALRAQDGRA